MLDDRRDVARDLGERATGDATPAGLVPRKAGAVGEQHARAAAREVDRGGRAGRAGAGYEHVEMLHPDECRGWV